MLLTKQIQPGRTFNIGFESLQSHLPDHVVSCVSPSSLDTRLVVGGSESEEDHEPGPTCSEESEEMTGYNCEDYDSGVVVPF